MADPLEFTVTWEAWYSRSLRETATAKPDLYDGDPTRSIEVQCLRADGVSSYASFEERLIGSRTTVRLHMWSDGWAILADHPSLWSRLAARLFEGCTLEDVVALLTEYGATDVTPRARPRTFTSIPKKD